MNTDEMMSLPQEWLDFCKRGKLPVRRQGESVSRSIAADGMVRGYYSDLVLNPGLDPTHSLYPSHDHTSHPRNHREMVVDARVVNDMKTHLSEPEFWRLIEHFYAVGLSKGKIRIGEARRLDSDWCPERHYGSSVARNADIK